MKGYGPLLWLFISLMLYVDFPNNNNLSTPKRYLVAFENNNLSGNTATNG